MHLFFCFAVHKSFTNMLAKSNTLLDTATVKTVNLSPSDQERERRQNNVEGLLNKHPDRIISANKILERVVTKSTEQEINSTKTFLSDMSISTIHVKQDLNINGKIDDIDLSEMNKMALFTDKDAVISADLIFNKKLTIKDVTVQGTIADVNPDDFITTNQDGIVTGSKVFENAAFTSNDDVKDITVDGLINGLSLSDALTISGNQTVNAKYTFNNTVKVYQDVEVNGTVNGEDISTVVDESVLINQPNIISAYKTFNSVTFNSDLNMKDKATINNVDVSELTKRGIHLSTEDTINATLIFSSNVTFQAPVSVLGNINDADVADAVYINQPAIITGSKFFDTDIKFSKEIDIDGNVNGVNISGTLNFLYWKK